MKIFLKYGIPPLIPIFSVLCLFIIAAEYFPIFDKKAFLSLFYNLSKYNLNLPENNLNLPENNIAQFADKEIFTITGVISSEPEYFETLNNFNNRVRFNLSVKNAEMGMVQMTIYNPLREYKEGGIITFKGKIKSLRNFNNPGGFDYVKYMQSKNLWAKVNVNEKNILSYKPPILRNRYNHLNLLDLKSYLDLRFYLNDFRKNFINHIFHYIKNKDAAAVFCALTTGNKDFISKELQQIFSKTGGSHILAISGLHLSIVAALFFYLFNMVLSFSSWLLIRGWSKKGAAVLTIFPIICYSLLSGFSDATQRAMIMVIIFMTATVIERERDNFNSLAFAGIVILIFDKNALFTISFQLSFSAVFFILMGTSLSNNYRRYIVIQNSYIRKFLDFLFISLCAAAGTQILVMHYFNISSFSGLISNLILIPFVGFGVLSIGLLSLFLYPASALISGLLIKSASFILVPCIEIMKIISEIPYSYIETFTPDIIEISCYYIFMTALFIALKSWKQDNNGLFQQDNNRFLQQDNNGFLQQDNNNFLFKSGVVIAGLSLAAIIFYEGIWINKRFFNNKLLITILDVGQGNSALIEMPKGKTILVDGGGFSYLASFDTGESIIAPFLRQKRIMTLDAVILTHPDSDHLNGLVYIFNHFKVKHFIKNCDEVDNSFYKALMAGVKQNGSKIHIINSESDEMLNNKISSLLYKTVGIEIGKIIFLHPFKPCRYNIEKYKKIESSINENSLVFKVVLDNTSILFTGDITAEIEENLVYKEGEILKSDILIAPHHGSSASSSDFFLDKAAPKSVIISCGWKNRFGFPKDIVLKRYKKRAFEVFRTDLNGAVTLCSDGTKWKITSYL